MSFTSIGKLEEYYDSSKAVLFVPLIFTMLSLIIELIKNFENKST